MLLLEGMLCMLYVCILLFLSIFHLLLSLLRLVSSAKRERGFSSFSISFLISIFIVSSTFDKKQFCWKSHLYDGNGNGNSNSTNNTNSGFMWLFENIEHIIFKFSLNFFGKLYKYKNCKSFING